MKSDASESTAAVASDEREESILHGTSLSKPSLALLALQLAACGGTASGAAEPMLGPLASWVVVIGLSLLLVHRVLEDWILAEIELVGRTVRRHVAGFHPNGGPAGEPGRDVEIVRG